jgi:hypothetical protein
MGNRTGDLGHFSETPKTLLQCGKLVCPEQTEYVGRIFRFDAIGRAL